MKKLLSLFLAFVMLLGILPTGAFAAATDESPMRAFELDPAGTTAWSRGEEPITVYTTQNGTVQATEIPAGEPFALLEDTGGDRLEIGYTEGGWTGGMLENTGWVDKEEILVNLPDLLPSIA